MKTVSFFIGVVCIFFQVFLPGGELGSESAPENSRVVLGLKWYHQFQFAGYYAALEKGFYEDEGLRVEIREGGVDDRVGRDIHSGKIQFGVLGSSALLRRAQGHDLVLLAIILQHSPMTLIVRKDRGIRSPASLIGKKVVISDHVAPEFRAMFIREGIDPERINILPKTKDSLDALVRGDIWAMSGSLANEPYVLSRMGIPVRLIHPINYGVDFYGDGIYTSATELQNRPRRVRKFLRASLKGWDYAFRNTPEIIDLILTKYNSRKSRAGLVYEAAKLRELTLPRLVQIGHVNEGRWERIRDTYKSLGLLKGEPDLDDFIYDSREGEFSERLLWLAGGLGVFILIISAISLGLFLFNRTLRNAVRERTIELEKESAERKQAQDYANRLNQELEQRVEERTSELSRVNERLRSINRELERANGDLEFFSYSLSHDLRGPLRHISGFSQLLAADYRAQIDSRGISHLNRIEEAGNRMANMIDDILILARTSRGSLKLEDVDLGVMIREIVEGLTKSYRNHPVKFIMAQAPIVQCDRELMRRALDNLLSNAWKYTSSNPADRLPALVEFGVQYPDREPVFFLKDNGAGFDMKYVDKLFKAFQRLHKESEFEGTGVGLATVQRILNRHGGNIWADSKPDEGAIFYFTI